MSKSNVLNTYSKCFDRILKQEPISKLEQISLIYSGISDNVVRRPAGQCLGNLEYFKFNSVIDGHSYFYPKEKAKFDSKRFVISDYFKNRVRCYMMFNFGYGRYFNYKDFEDAMVWDYFAHCRNFIIYKNRLDEKEERCVRMFVRGEINAMRKVGYYTYRADFRKNNPKWFVSEERRNFRCIDNSLSRNEKISACHEHKRKLRENIFDSFEAMILRNPQTVSTWFDTRVDNEGFTRICFSEKAIENLNRRLRRNGLREASGVYLFNQFCKRLKEKSGSKTFTIKIFITNVMMLAFSKGIDIKRIKKPVCDQLQKLFKKAAKASGIRLKKTGLKPKPKPKPIKPDE